MALADRAAAGHREQIAKLHLSFGAGWHEDHDGFSVVVTGIPAPPFNGVSVYGAHDRELLRHTLERVAASGCPFGLQTRAAVTESVADLAESLHMERQPSMPLMVITRMPEASVIPGLEIRELGMAEIDAHAVVAAEAFAAPLGLMRELTRFAVSRPDVHVISGFRDGRAVSTALADVNGPTAAILDVATLERERGHGFGAAVTAATVRAGLGAGAQLCFLLSTPMGERVYEGLGFQRLERWTAWVGLPGA